MKLLSALLLLVSSSAVLAHGVWVAPRYGDLGVVYGMSYTDDGYTPDKVRDVKGYTASFEPYPVTVRPQQKYSTLQVGGDAAVLTVFFDNGYWEKGADGKWQAVKKHAITKPADTSTSLKYNISLLKPYEGKMRPFNMPVQIIPDTDPSKLKQGETFTVTVYVDGKPKSGVEIITDYINDFGNRVKTGTDGKAVLTVRNSALNVIAALVDHPTPKDKHARLQRNVATLSFRANK